VASVAMSESSVGNGVHMITVWYYTESDLRDNLKAVKVAYFDNTHSWDLNLSDSVNEMKG
jgi:hypothetical protein